jgi:inosine-uridine nucleoside N-ribohydrolase
VIPTVIDTDPGIDDALALLLAWGSPELDVLALTNAYVDPEAAGEVFEAGLRVDLVPLDATRQTRIDGGQLHAALARRPGPVAARIAAFTEQTFRTWGYMNLHDPLAVGLAVDESLARWETARISVGEGGHTRRADGEPNCRVAKVIDGERFVALFFNRLCPASS